MECDDCPFFPPVGFSVRGEDPRLEAIEWLTRTLDMPNKNSLAFTCILMFLGDGVDDENVMGAHGRDMAGCPWS